MRAGGCVLGATVWLLVDPVGVVSVAATAVPANPQHKITAPKVLLRSVICFILEAAPPSVALTARPCARSVTADEVLASIKPSRLTADR